MNNRADDSLVGALIELRERRHFVHPHTSNFSCLLAGTKVVILGFEEKGNLVKVLTPDGIVCTISMFSFSADRGFDVWEQEISSRLDK